MLYGKVVTVCGSMMTDSHDSAKRELEVLHSLEILAFCYLAVPNCPCRWWSPYFCWFLSVLRAGLSLRFIPTDYISDAQAVAVQIVRGRSAFGLAR